MFNLCTKIEKMVLVREEGELSVLRGMGELTECQRNMGGIAKFLKGKGFRTLVHPFEIEGGTSKHSYVLIKTTICEELHRSAHYFSLISLLTHC